jgi:type IV fimbrial biogenesis protein FimT
MTADVTLRPATRGFTMIELMAGIAIAALLVFLAAPSFTTFLRNSEIRSTSESIINGLRAASSEAARQNRRVMFTLAGSNSASWAINLVNDPVDCADPVMPAIQSYVKEEAGKNSTITSTPAGQLKVCFDGVGRVVKQGTPNDHIQQIDIASVVAGEARPLRIIVDDPNPPAAGKPRGLRLCDPDTNLPADDPRRC